MCKDNEPCQPIHLGTRDPDTPTPLSSSCTTPQGSVHDLETHHNENHGTENAPSRAETISTGYLPPPPALLTRLLPRPQATPPPSPSAPAGANPMSPTEEASVTKSSLINGLIYLSRLTPAHLSTTTTLSVRDPAQPHTFLLAPSHLSASALSESDILRFSLPSANLLAGPGTLEQLAVERKVNVAAALVLAKVYGVRPEVNAVLISQNRTLGAFSAIDWGEKDKETAGLCMLTAEACAFYQNVVLLPTFSAIISKPKEAKKIAKSLGQSKAMLLRNHGVLTVGSSLESCIYWFTTLERCCDLQIKVWHLRKKVIPIDEEKAAGLQKFVGSEEAGLRAGKAEMDAVLGFGIVGGSTGVRTPEETIAARLDKDA